MKIDVIEDLEKRKTLALKMGGDHKIEAQNRKGSYTARERILRLLDPGSFMEIGMLAHSDVPGMEIKTPADGKISGFGKINGRSIGVSANDATVLAGSGGRVGHKKAIRILDTATKKGFPFVNIGEAGGARIPDIQGSDGMSSMTITNRVAFRTRQIPMVATIMGECFGDPSWMVALSDFSIQVKGSCMAVSSPRVLEIATNEKVSNDELGGWQLHAQITGQIDRVAENEDECLELVKEFLSYLPQNSDELPPAIEGDDSAKNRQNTLLKILPERSNQSYDMKRLIRTIVDHEKLFELKPEFDPSVITCLARIDGKTIGIIANQPSRYAGAMGPDGCDKCTSFICLCDSFNIPLLFLHDTPGFFVGKAAEQKKMPSKIITFIQALSLATVPKISIVIRKSYGMANCNMGGANMGSDFLFAWPGADISFMGPEVAVNVIFGEKLKTLENPEQLKQAALQSLRKASEPWKAAGLAYLDDVIYPVDTRSIILQCLDLTRIKNGGRSQRLLANWPTAI
ncbi:hypothetical protein KJ966_07255 [bacterium]|nr:hypothetical protein [bacterium]